MLNYVLYVIAIVVGYFLVWFYQPSKDKRETDSEDLSPDSERKDQRPFKLNSILAVLGLDAEEIKHFEAFEEHFKSFEEVSKACKQAGLENSNLIIGVDFTASNEWQGRKSFSQNCLHKTNGKKVYNPYQKVISILGQTLKPFDEDNLIPVFGFGDESTKDEDVFSFNQDTPCEGFQEVLNHYNEIVKNVKLSGPTSFAPVIQKSIEIVKQTNKYHILVIIADGQVNDEGPTIRSIVEASNYPLSIIVVGVGDGPWEVMAEFDHRLPKRKFDNFRFVNFHKVVFKAKNPDTAFALQALMEIPDQYKVIKMLGYLDKEDDNISLRRRISRTSVTSVTV